jgi:flagellar hook assembly protein FlgD
MTAISKIPALTQVNRPSIQKNPKKDPTQMFMKMLTTQLKHQTPETRVDSQAMCDSFLKLFQFQQQNEMSKQQFETSKQQFETSKQQFELTKETLDVLKRIESKIA